MTVQRDPIVNLIKAIIDKNNHTTKVVAEACWSIPELGILDDEPIHVRIQKLATGVRDARTELEKVQFDLNLKIAELQLRPNLQPCQKFKSSARQLWKMPWQQ